MLKSIDNLYVLIFILFFIFIILYKFYRYQEELEKKDYLIEEIGKFQNQIHFLKENPDMKYQLKDEDIFEIITDYERFTNQRY
jgi:hypothetical protein